MILHNLDEYQALAKRTMANSPTQEEMLNHCILGIAGESGEIALCGGGRSSKEYLLELGDALWYSSGLATALGISLQGIYIFSLGTTPGFCSHLTPMGQLFSWSSRMAELFKKHRYGKKALPSSELEDSLAHYLRLLFLLGGKVGYSPLEIAEGNLRKLEARYPEHQWSYDRSIQRADESKE